MHQRRIFLHGGALHAEAIGIYKEIYKYLTIFRIGKSIPMACITGIVIDMFCLDYCVQIINFKGRKENIVLVGMPASGKSTVGNILAEKLGRKFVDTDEIITEKIKMSIKDFFAEYGEEEFRKIECEVIRELSAENSLIIATGGGAVLRQENISALKYNGKIYFIDRPIEKLIPTESRPLSSDREAIKKRHEERYGIYCGCCDVHIDADCEAEAVAKKILENFFK